MRIGYVYVGARLDRTVGITGKLIDQTNAWRARGHDVRLFLQTYTPTGVSGRLMQESGLAVESFVDRPIGGLSLPRALRDRLTSLSRLVSAVRSWEPALVYVRFSMSFGALVALARALPTVLEINTDDLAEYRATLRWYKYWYHRLTRAKLLDAAAGAVYVTEELATRPHLRRSIARSTVIANGVVLARYGQLPAQPKPRARLVFIGEPGFPWHGVDKVLILARLCPDWDFDVVGYGEHDVGTAVPANLRLHGYLEPERYVDVVAAADVALGTLALHRKDMDEACPLKVREYLARGLPTITAYRDPDFHDGAWFLLQLPNTEDNVVANLASVRAFVDRVRGQRVPRAALGHLDVEVKERRRLEFLDQVARDFRRGPRASAVRVS